MPVFSDADAMVGDQAVTAYVGKTEAGASAGGSGPLAGAAISHDFRTLTAWPAAWTNPYHSSMGLTDFVFDGTGAVNPGLNGASGKDIYYLLDVPAGVDFWQMTCIYHVYFPTPAPFTIRDYGDGPFTQWWSNLEFTIIHDPSNDYDAERWTAFESPRNDPYSTHRPPQAGTYAYDDNIEYDDSVGEINLKVDDTALEDVEAVMSSWADATGFHMRVAFASGERFVVNMPPATPPPASHTTLNQLLLQAYYNGTGPDAQGSPWTLKGVYILDHPIDDATAEEIAVELMV